VKVGEIGDGHSGAIGDGHSGATGDGHSGEVATLVPLIKN